MLIMKTMSFVKMKIVTPLTIQSGMIVLYQSQPYLKQDDDMEGSFDHPSGIVIKNCDYIHV